MLACQVLACGLRACKMIACLQLVCWRFGVLAEAGQGVFASGRMRQVGSSEGFEQAGRLFYLVGRGMTPFQSSGGVRLCWAIRMVRKSFTRSVAGTS